MSISGFCCFGRETSFERRLSPLLVESGTPFRPLSKGGDGLDVFKKFKKNNEDF